MPELSDRNFCGGLERKEFLLWFERKFTSRLGGIQQAGAPETAVKSVTPHFIFG